MASFDTRPFKGEDDLTAIAPMASKDLSEPYSIYTYR